MRWEMFKIVTTVLIAILMIIFLLIWVSTAEEKKYTWIWILIEVVYICSLVAIWG